MSSERDASGVELRMGFHAVPSMVQLHMHMVSDDFDSEYLKHKKHWNSFTTEFFLQPDTLIREIEENGSFSVRGPWHSSHVLGCCLTVALQGKEHYEDVLKQPLRCHKCGAGLTNMPKLKQHIRECE